METTTWTPAVGDTFTSTTSRDWHIGDQSGEHTIATRMEVVAVSDRTFRYERVAVLSETGVPPMQRPWAGPDRGEMLLTSVERYVAIGQISDIDEEV